MMSGLVTPYSVGLIDERDIYKLLRYRLVFKVIGYQTKYIEPLIAFMAQFILVLFNENLINVITFGISLSIQNSIFIYFYNNFLIYQILCLHILCTYLELKLNNLNKRLIEMKKSKRFVRIREILYSFDVIYREINEYNTTFWSKFLFIFWSLFGSFFITVIYLSIYSNLNIILKIILFYCSIFLLFIFNYIISKVCSLNSEANKSYKIFHSFIIHYNQSKLFITKSNIRTNIKVSFILLYNMMTFICFQVELIH